MRLTKKLIATKAMAITASLTLATSAFGQTIIFNGHETYEVNAVNTGGRFFLTVEDLNYVFQTVYGLDVNNYNMFFEYLDPPSIEINGVVHVPIRAFAEALGWIVDWADQQIIISFPEDYISIDDFLAINPIENNQAEIIETAIENPAITGGLHRVTHGDNTAYIFGSFHAGMGHWFPLADVVENAMDSADVFAFEVNMDSPSEEEVARFMETMSQLIHLPDGQRLSDILDPEVHQNFVEAVESFGLFQYEDFYRMNPAFISTSVAVQYLIPMMGLDFDYSVDDYVAMRAILSDRPVIGLAPMYTEIQTVFDLPLDVMIEQVESFVSREQIIELFMQEGYIMDAMIMAYANNDIETLRDVIAYVFSLYPDYELSPGQLHTRDVVNFARSIQFGEAIENLLRETEDPTTFFVTVGVAHVVRGGTGINDDGITNVINFLENAGFEVEALH